MNGLAIVNQAQDELGQTRSSSLAATDAGTRQFLALANAHGRYLMKKHTWSAIQALATITLANGTEDYAVASDFDRFIDDTQWDRTNAWELIGPISPQFDRFRRETLGATLGPRRAIRLLGTTIRVSPTPTANGDVLVYEYISNKWARSSGGTPQTTITGDSDTTVFDDQLMVLGIKYRYRHGKGYEADSFKDEHDDYYDLCKSSDIGVGVINMNPESLPEFITLDNIPDTGYGV